MQLAVPNHQPPYPDSAQSDRLKAVLVVAQVMAEFVEQGGADLGGELPRVAGGVLVGATPEVDPRSQLACSTLIAYGSADEQPQDLGLLKALNLEWLGVIAEFEGKLGEGRAEPFRDSRDRLIHAAAKRVQRHAARLIYRLLGSPGSSPEAVISLDQTSAPLMQAAGPEPRLAVTPMALDQPAGRARHRLGIGVAVDGPSGGQIAVESRGWHGNHAMRGRPATTRCWRPVGIG